MMTKRIIIANWKMNFDFQETTCFLRNLIKKTFEQEKYNINNKIIIIAPSFPFLHISNQIIRGTDLKIAAQNVSSREKGAYTGEVSAEMLTSIGIDWVIIGHNECRKNMFETDDTLLKKIKISIKNKLKVIFCIGETEDERNNNKFFSKIENQLNTIFYLNKKEIKNICIAYEPIWAIGSGVHAENKQIKIIHEFIRYLFNKKYGKNISNNISILYGGSINNKNMKKIFSEKNVNGGMIGNSSLNLNEFINIINY